MSTQKHNVFSLEDRVKVVECLAKGKSARSVAQSLNVGKTQVQTIAKEKDDILCYWKDGENGDCKYGKKRKCAYEDLNAVVWEWFCDARACNIPISGVMIQEKAVLLSLSYGYGDFTGLNGWLNRWKARHNIRCFVLNGENADIPEETVRD